jgi:hypothetical protein
MELSDKFGFKGPIEVQSGRCVGIPLLGVFGDAQPQAVDQGQALFDAQCLRIEIGHGHISIVATPVRCGESPSVERFLIRYGADRDLYQSGVFGV